MKYLILLLTLSFAISCSTLNSHSVKTLEIEFKEVNQLVSIDNSETNFIYKSITDNLKAGKDGVFLVYQDTISTFDESTFTETFKVLKHEIPISIIRIK